MFIAQFATDLSRFSDRNLITETESRQSFEAIDPQSREKVELLLIKTVNPEIGQQQIFHELGCLSFNKHLPLLRMIGFSLNPSPHSLVEIAFPFHQNRTLSYQLDLEYRGSTIFTPTQKSKLIFGIVAGMAFLHSHNIIHCDLNPANIFLNNHFEPLIGGFKFLCRPREKRTCQCETEWYLCSAPEFILEEVVCDFPMDVYSFAIILYFIFGKPPELDGRSRRFRSPMALVNRMSRGFRFERNSDIPDGLWEVIEECWRHDPAERPTFQDLLDSFRGGERYRLEEADVGELLKYEETLEKHFRSKYQL
jgi:serine/threonine protein kinase